MAKQSKTKKTNQPVEVEIIPERFLNYLKNRKLFYLKPEINETKPKQFDGYVFCGLGDGGSYYIKEN